MLLGFQRAYISGLLIVLVAIFSACSKSSSPPAEDSTTPPDDYCPYLPSRTYSSNVTVNGTADYQFRTNGDGAVSGTTNPIRYAEVEVRNSSGTIVQCAETDGNGDFTFQLPANTGSYTIYVNSRANNSTTKAYVLADPTTNQHYSVSITVGSSANSTPALVASATGAVIGGAFNIFDKVVEANLFLQNEAGAAACAALANGSEAETECGLAAFTVAPLSYIYWKKGFNPNSYLGAPSDPVSFFLRGTNEVYILGGVADDVDSSDTDHFDNSIIVHEYGHYIEEVYSKSDSQGGIHYADSMSEPRLVWSEAFANFFQAAVLNDLDTANAPVYRDTIGNVSCGGGCSGAFHNENLETYTVAGTFGGSSGYDNPATVAAGEGSFREFSLTRALWDVVDTNNDGEAVDSAFAELWSVFAGPNMLKLSSRRFRSAGLFFKLQDEMTARITNWSTVRTNEDQRDDQTHYGQNLLLSGGADPNCPVTMTPRDTYTGIMDSSDLFAENDYYAYYHSGGTLRVYLSYTTGGGDVTNLDLIVWKDNYQFGNTDDIAGSSGLARGDSDGLTEDVTVSSAPAGWYIINVAADQYDIYPNVGSTSTYKLRIFVGGTQYWACPIAGS